MRRVLQTYPRCLLLASLALVAPVVVSLAVASATPRNRSQRAEDAPAVVENVCVPALHLSSGWCGDGGRATRALLSSPADVTSLADGSVAFTDGDIPAVRRIRRDGVIDRIASRGDSIAGLADGGFVLGDSGGNRVWRVARDGTITTAAGTGRAGFSGDGGPATAARLSGPGAVAALDDGGFLVADTENHRIRRVDGAGIITTVAGSGTRGFSGDGGPAVSARLRSPYDVTALPDAGFLVADDAQGPSDSERDRLRRVTSGGKIDTILTVSSPLQAVAAGRDGSIVVVVDSAPRRLGADGTLRPVVRNACPALRPGLNAAYNIGDGGPARRALLAATDVDVSRDGSLLITDWAFSRVRRVDAAGRITTLAGGGGISGKVALRDSPCGGASPDYAMWNYFGIVRARAKRHKAVVEFGTTLSALVTLSARLGRRVVHGSRRVGAGAKHKIALGLTPGRYRLRLHGRHGRLHQDDRSRVRIR